MRTAATEIRWSGWRTPRLGPHELSCVRPGRVGAGLDHQIVNEQSAAASAAYLSCPDLLSAAALFPAMHGGFAGTYHASLVLRRVFSTRGVRLHAGLLKHLAK